MSSRNVVSPKQIIKCINIARQYPKYFIPLLDQQIHSFQNDFEYRINNQTICETNEGKDAWLSAKKFLQAQKPIPSLLELRGLAAAAQNHAYDLEKMDQITHSGSDGSTFVDRIMKFCQKSEGALVEIIGNDFDIEERNHAEMIVLGLIIDDGVTSRGHRNSIFNPEYKYIGVGVGYLSGKIVGVINMSHIKLKEKSTQGEVSSSISNLKESKTSKVPRNMEEVQEENIMHSRTSQVSNQSGVSSNITSEKSHKSQKVWTFTKVEEQSKKIVYENSSTPRDERRQPRHNKDSTISINKNRREDPFTTQTKQNMPSGKSIPSSQSSQHKTRNDQQSQSPFNTPMKSSTNQPKSQGQYQQFLGQDITNSKSLDQSKSFYTDSMKSQGSGGFKKIKEKKETSRIWQEGEFKYDQKTTVIRYTDGTEEEFKEKTSVLVNDDPNV